MSARLAVKLGKSLFDEALEGGAKVADESLLPLRDSGVMVQTKAGGQPDNILAIPRGNVPDGEMIKPDNYFFDSAKWREANPRPHADVKLSDMSPAQKKEYTSWSNKLTNDRKRAVEFGVNKHLGWDEDAWLSANPHPFPGKSMQEIKDLGGWNKFSSWSGQRGAARKEAIANFSEVVFDEAAWLVDNPNPVSGIKIKDLTPEQKTARGNWTVSKQRAKFSAYEDYAAKMMGWDEAAYRGANPHPAPNKKPSEMSPDELKLHQQWNKDRKFALQQTIAPDVVAARAQTQRENAAQVRRESGIVENGHLMDPKNVDPEWNEEAWIAANPNPQKGVKRKDMTPEQLREYKAWSVRKSNAKKKSSVLAAQSAAERATRLLRGSPAANPEEINKVYQMAKNLEGITGVSMDVDHLIPLQGDYVSGLHHQDNLFVLPSTVNRSKNNAFDLDEYLSIPESAQRLTSGANHDAFVSQFKDDIADAIAKKRQISSGVAERLNHEIIDPTTKVGRNAQNLWGEDYERYAEDIRRQIGLLGV